MAAKSKPNAAAKRLPLNEPILRPTFRRERRWLNKGCFPIAGCDEAGRGPLAGPVVAAAVILDPARIPRGLNDSKKLTAVQPGVHKIEYRVAAGAEYQLHWSFLTPTRPKPPEVKDKTWVRNPIDNFVLAKLEAAGLKPAPEADRRTLARRPRAQGISCAASARRARGRPGSPH